MLTWPFSSLLVSPKEELICLSGTLKFVTAAQRISPDCLVVVACRLMLVVLQEYIFLHNFKSCSLKVWLSISPNLGTKSLPALNTEILAHPQLLELLNIAALLVTKV